MVKYTQNTHTMRSITFEGKKINFDFSLGSINDVYVKELNGDFNDLLHMEDFKSEPSKLIEITRDMLLSAHIYFLFIHGFIDEAEEILSKLKSYKMIATKWLIETNVITVVEWITSDLMPSDLDKPKVAETIKKKK